MSFAVEPQSGSQEVALLIWSFVVGTTAPFCCALKVTSGVTARPLFAFLYHDKVSLKYIIGCKIHLMVGLEVPELLYQKLYASEMLDMVSNEGLKMRYFVA